MQEILSPKPLSFGPYMVMFDGAYSELRSLALYVQDEELVYSSWDNNGQPGDQASFDVYIFSKDEGGQAAVNISRGAKG